MHKNTRIIITSIAVVVVGFLLWSNARKQHSVVETPVQALDKATQVDTTSAIDANLNAINPDLNVDADFNSVDSDLKNL